MKTLIVRFIVDGMLGRLARWLRIAGHDTLYVHDLKVDPGEEDDLLLQLAAKQKRILLTSDELLYARAAASGLKSVLITSKEIVNQFLEISKSLGRPIEVDFENSRCPMCNGMLVEADPLEAPSEVRDRKMLFWKCLKCRKIYWEGKHWRSILKTTERYKHEVKRSLSG